MGAKRYQLICNDCEQVFPVIRKAGWIVGDLMLAICPAGNYTECLVLSVADEESVKA